MAIHDTVRAKFTFLGMACEIEMYANGPDEAIVMLYQLKEAMEDSGDDERPSNGNGAHVIQDVLPGTPPVEVEDAPECAHHHALLRRSHKPGVAWYCPRPNIDADIDHKWCRYRIMADGAVQGV